jgi:sugar lactone lactonase YvrE
VSLWLCAGAQGELLLELHVPAPEITGLAIKGRTLYVTEGSTNSLYAIEL